MNGFSEIETVVRGLDKASLQIYLKDEDIIKKCEKLDVEVLQNKTVEKIKTDLEYHERSLRKDLHGIIEAIEVAKKEGGTSQEIFNNFKEFVEDNLKEIAKNINELTTLHDFLEHIHLSPEEIEFYTMKKRGKTHDCINVFSKDEVEFFYKEDRYLLVKIGDNIQKWNNLVWETYRRDKHTKYIKNKGKIPITKFEESQFDIPQGNENIRKNISYVVENLERKGLAEKAATIVKSIYRKSQVNVFLEFNNEIGYNSNNKAMSKIMKLEIERRGDKTIIHGYPYNL